MTINNLLAILVSSSIMVISCNDTTKQEAQTENQLNDWKIDSLGCNGIRSEILSEKLIKEHNLKGDEISSFLKTFGKPNREDTINQEIILGYCFNSICREGRLVDSSDYCISEFHFINGRFEEGIYICL